MPATLSLAHGGGGEDLGFKAWKTVENNGVGAGQRKLLGLVLAVAAGVMLLMLLGGAFSTSLAAGRRRLEDRVSQREREIARMKAGAYDEVSQKIDALAKLVEERTREVAGHPSVR